jgi:SAM-dependent methyltransferase
VTDSKEPTKSATVDKSGLPPLEEVDWSKYDFLDLGCSAGGSIRHCIKRFGTTRVIGLDRDPRKVLQAREKGFDAIVADVVTLDVNRKVPFVSMLDFLEHLPSLELVEQVIGTAARAATDFLFIFHPSFEGEDYLTELGLRQYWWDWHGHRCHPTVADYCSIFERLNLNQYMIRYVDPVESSGHESILPTSAPIDQHGYDEKKHDRKPKVDFAHPLWRAQEIFVGLRAVPPEEWARVTRPHVLHAERYRAPHRVLRRIERALRTSKRSGGI